MHSNRPSSFNVRDNVTKTIIANFSSHNQATDYCFALELKPTMEGVHWRYTIEPVRN